MLAEVQYGGRVTDDFDKRLLNTFTNVWFNDQLLVTGFKFYDGYTLPDCKTVEEYSEFITNLPIQVKNPVKPHQATAFRIFLRCLAFMPTQTSPTKSTRQRGCWTRSIRAFSSSDIISPSDSGCPAKGGRWR